MKELTGDTLDSDRFLTPPLGQVVSQKGPDSMTDHVASDDEVWMMVLMWRIVLV